MYFKVELARDSYIKTADISVYVITFCLPKAITLSGVRLQLIEDYLSPYLCLRLKRYLETFVMLI
jgi:hypothetical protein